MHTENQKNQLYLHKDFLEIEELVEQNEDMLYNLCYRLTQNLHDAQDLYQQTWLKAIQRLDSFTNKSMKNWLYTICLNLYRDSYWRNRRKQQIISNSYTVQAQEHAMENASDKETAESAAIKNIQSETLLGKIEQLSDKLRLPIILFYFDGLDYKAIAQILKVPIGTVKSRLNLAKSRLREGMEKEHYV